MNSSLSVPPMHVESPSLQERFPDVSYFAYGDPAGVGRPGLWGHTGARWYLLNCDTNDPRWSTPIKPRHIDGAPQMGATIGRTGIEGIAETVLAYLRKFDEWTEFTPDQVGCDISFLAELGWVVPGKVAGSYRATNGLVLMAFSKNPAVALS